MTEPTDGLPRPQIVTAAYSVAADTAFGDVAPPLYLSGTYEFPGYDEPRLYDYGRAGNPNRELLGNALAELEAGAEAVITSISMSALDLLVGQHQPDDLILAPHDCYGGTMRLLKARADLGHCSLCYAGGADADLDRPPWSPAQTCVRGSGRHARRGRYRLPPG